MYILITYLCGLSTRDDAYEILFSFASLEDKNGFLGLVSTNSDLGYSYVEDDLKIPTATESNYPPAEPGAL